MTLGWIEYLPESNLPAMKRGADPRVTSKFAAFCRRFSIDELPQLLHVISGRMRFAGPRPLTSIEMAVFYKDVAPEILAVKPGITGLWQVMGRNHLTNVLGSGPRVARSGRNRCTQESRKWTPWSGECGKRAWIWPFSSRPTTPGRVDNSK